MERDPQSINVNIAIPVSLFRPENTELCTDELFEVFLAAHRHVQTNPNNFSALHQTIRSTEDCFVSQTDGKGHMSLCEYIAYMKDNAACTVFLHNRSIATGILRHTWVPTVHGWHPWLEQFEKLMNPHMDEDDTTTAAGLLTLTQGTPHERLKLFVKWFKDIDDFRLAQHATYDDIRQKVKEPGFIAPEGYEPGDFTDNIKKSDVSAEIVMFPLHLKLSCKLPVANRRTEIFNLKLIAEKDGIFTIEITWRQSKNGFSYALDIPNRMVEALNLDTKPSIDQKTQQMIKGLPLSLQAALPKAAGQRSEWVAAL